MHLTRISGCGNSAATSRTPSSSMGGATEIQLANVSARTSPFVQLSSSAAASQQLSPYPSIVTTGGRSHTLPHEIARISSASAVANYQAALQFSGLQQDDDGHLAGGGYRSFTSGGARGAREHLSQPHEMMPHEMALPSGPQAAWAHHELFHTRSMPEMAAAAPLSEHHLAWAEQENSPSRCLPNPPRLAGLPAVSDPGSSPGRPRQQQPLWPVAEDDAMAMFHRDMADVQGCHPGLRVNSMGSLGVPRAVSMPGSSRFGRHSKGPLVSVRRVELTEQFWRFHVQCTP